MGETAREATDRLRREGRWDEACRFRDETRQQLRMQGKTRREAYAMSWTAMSDRFPPPTVPDVSTSEQTLEEIVRDEIRTEVEDWLEDSGLAVPEERLAVLIEAMLRWMLPIQETTAC